MPYLKMYYAKTGKAALKDNSTKKQLFQFGSKECSKEYLYEILDRAIEMILSDRLEFRGGQCQSMVFCPSVACWSKQFGMQKEIKQEVFVSGCVY